MFGAVGIIGNFIGMFTGLIVPYIYQTLGLEDNYDVLEVASFREDMFEVLIVAGIIGAAVNTIPFFFYDLTENKQRGIMKVLRIRALFEDYGNGVLNDKALVDAIDLIDEANELYIQRKFIVTKDDIKKAKKLPKNTPENKQHRKEEITRLKLAYKEYNKNEKAKIKGTLKNAKSLPSSTPEEKLERKAAIKEARAKNKAYKALNDDIAVCDFVVDEMKKYETLRMQKQVERSQAVLAGGVDGICSTQKSIKKQAKALPKATAEQKAIRSDAIAHARAMLTCKKMIKKYYRNGVTKPAENAVELAEAMPANGFFEQIARKRAIKARVNELSRYSRSVKVLLEAQRILTEKENYTKLDNIRAQYDQAKQRVLQSEKEEKENIERLEAERKADIEAKKLARLERKNRKGGL